MSWVAVGKDGMELISTDKPIRRRTCGFNGIQYWEADVEVDLPKGSIKKLIGRDLTWEDEAVKLK